MIFQLFQINNNTYIPTKLVSTGLLVLMIVGFIQGLSPNTGKVEIKSSKEFYDTQTIPLSDQIKLPRLEKTSVNNSWLKKHD